MPGRGRGAPAVIKFLVVGLALAAGFVPIPPTTVERWYSTGLYPAIQRHLTPFSNALPFALFDLVVVAATVAVIAAVFWTVSVARRTGRVRPVVHLLGHLIVFAALIYLAFLSLWGFNYRRVPMESSVVVEDRAPSSQAVTALGMEAVVQLNTLHDEAHRIGWESGPSNNEALRAAFISAQRTLNDAPAVEPGRLKRTIFGPYFRWTSIDGMVNPFGLEVLANPDLLAFERPFVAAHEWAHLAGYADESEASFVGWLACMRGDAAARYSGWLFLYWQVTSEIDVAGRAELASALHAGPRSDIQAAAERQQRGQLPWLSAVSWQVYDRYLKANRVDEGVRSYGAVVNLILRTRFDPDWTPVRRSAVQLPGS
jgi:hypothetical protein